MTKRVRKIKQWRGFLANNPVEDIPQDQKTKQHHIIIAPFSMVRHQLHHHPPSTQPSLLPTSSPTSSPTLPPSLSPSTSTNVAQVIAHCHRHCSPRPPSSMSSKDNAALPPPTPPLPLLLCQPDKVKEIMAKVVSNQSADKYAWQNSMFALFCYESAELQDVLLEPWFIDGLSMHAKENAKKTTQKMLHDYESRGQ